MLKPKGLMMLSVEITGIMEGWSKKWIFQNINISLSQFWNVTIKFLFIDTLKKCSPAKTRTSPIVPESLK